MLKAQNVAVQRGGRSILHQLSLSLNPGELVVALGPSGSGKSTLMKVLSGLLRPDAGQVFFGDRDLSRMSDQELAGAIGLVPQDDIVHGGLCVEEALRFSARLRLPPAASNEEIEAAVVRVLQQTELQAQASTRIRRLSGGQRKRVSVGVELLASPPFLILDEPTSGLDPALEDSMMRLFQSLARSGHGLMVSTHSMASLELADALLIVLEGRLIFFGPLRAALKHFAVPHAAEIFKALKARPASEWRKLFEGSEHFARSTATRGAVLKSAMQHPALAEIAALAAGLSSGPSASGAERRESKAPKDPVQEAVDESAEALLARLAAEMKSEGGLQP